MPLKLSQERALEQEIIASREQLRLTCGHTRANWFPTTVANGFVPTMKNGLAISTTTTTLGLLTFFPIIVPEIFVKQVKFEVTTLVAASSASCGFYTNAEDGCRPEKLIWQSPSASTASNGVKTFDCNMFLPRGLIWQAFAGNDSVVFRAPANGGYWSLGVNSLMQTNWTTCCYLFLNAIGNFPSSVPSGAKFTLASSRVPISIMLVSNAYNK